MSGAYDVKLDTYNLMLDATDAGYNGSFSFQDISPSWVQFAQGEAGYASVQPFAEQVQSSWAGSIGLYEQTDAPGDNSRCYVSDLNTTIPHNLSVWQRYPGDTVARPGTTTVAPFIGVDSVDGQGCIVGESGGFAYIRWNGSTHGFDRVRGWAVAGGVNTGAGVETFAAPSTASLRASTGTGGAGEFRAVQSDGSIWAMQGASPYGAWDVLSAASTRFSAVRPYFVFVPVADVLLGIGPNDTTLAKPGLWIDVFSVYDGTLTTRTQKEWNGGATVGVKTPNEPVVLGACACEGLVYFTTDRAVYTILWQEDTERVVVNKLIDAPLQMITSGPVNHLGEVYFGMGNGVAKISPGQRGYVPIPVDANGYMPAPWSSEVVRCYSIGQALYAIAREPSFGGQALLRLDSKNAWSCLQINTGSNRFFPRGMPIVFERNSGYGISALCAADTSTSLWRPAPIFDSNRNPFAYPVALRQQQAGSHFTVGAWQYGTNRISPKHLLMTNGEVKDVSTTFPIRLWVQYDDDETQADSFVGATPTFPDAKATQGLGKWTLLQQFDNGAASVAAGLTTYTTNGVTAARGNIWTSLIQSNLAQHNRWRIAVEIVGDTTGNTMPTFQALKWRWLEYPAKYRTYKLRVRIAMKNLTTPAGGPQSGADVQAIVDGLYAMASNKRLVDAYLPDGTSNPHKVIVSKVNFDAAVGNNNGVVGQQSGVVPRVREWVGSIDLQEIIPLGGGGG